MTVKEVEAAGLSLPEEERIRVAETLLAGVGRHRPAQPRGREDDPIWEPGRDPMDTGLGDASVNLDHYLYHRPE